MPKELKEQVEAAGAAAEESNTEAASTETTSSEAMSEATQEVPNIKEQIDAAVQEVIRQYEGTDGHLAKLRSKYDTKIAGLEKRLRAQTDNKVQEAAGLMESNPAKAAQILQDIVEAQAQEAQQATARRELVGWQKKILGDLGADVDTDEEAAELAAKWTDRLVENPDLTWDFQQAAATLQLEREKAATKAAAKELEGLKENLPTLIQAQVTQALVQAGIVPDTSGGGEAIPQKEEDWRKKPTGQLITDGLAKRLATPIKRQPNT